ncbi:MAG: ADP-ribosylation factor-like protein, partial [bacterium]|nr:ADP-ribosylation factor-like protein [bacterium]
MSPTEKSKQSKPALELQPEPQPRKDHPVLLATLKGHTNHTFCVAITPDGKRIVSGSGDNTLKVWDSKSYQLLATLNGHTDYVRCVEITPDGKRIVSGSDDKTLKVWDCESFQLHTTLKGHTKWVRCVEITPDGKRIVSGSEDQTIKVWDSQTYQLLTTLEGHTNTVRFVPITPDGKRIVSGSSDYTVKVWDSETYQLLKTLKGHTKRVWGVAITPDGKRIVSGSADYTIKVWDSETYQLLTTLEGHTSDVNCVSITPDGKHIVSGSDDHTIKIWDSETYQLLATLEGHILRVWSVAITPDGKQIVSGSSDNTIKVWDFELALQLAGVEPEKKQRKYTSAKIVLLGDTGVGKTALANRLVSNTYQATESTHEMKIHKLELPDGDEINELEREAWLWDFAGQADYKLTTQLFLNETTAALLVFNPQDRDPFPIVSEWQKILSKAKIDPVVKLLVAGRCERGGPIVSHKAIQDFVTQQALNGFYITSAKTGLGIPELLQAIHDKIPWQTMSFTVSPEIFKRIKDDIFKLRKELPAPIITRQALQALLIERLKDEDGVKSSLDAVLSILEGQGVVICFPFGDLVLLLPELLNGYAATVMQNARQHTDELGCVSENAVLEGKLDYQDFKRLANKEDEKLLLTAMLKLFNDKALCLREDTKNGTMLVFPSYFRRERPDKAEYPDILVTYSFTGPLEEIYASLVVRLTYSGVVEKDQLWHYAADFKTETGLQAGIAMKDCGEGKAELVVYFDSRVELDTKIVFIRFVHDHLHKMAHDVIRVRTYQCKTCHYVLDLTAISKRVKDGKSDIGCPVCDSRVNLNDIIEQKFNSDLFEKRVREMEETAQIVLDNQSKELILIGNMFVIAGEANQIFRPTIIADWGVDGEIEFKKPDKDEKGNDIE